MFAEETRLIFTVALDENKSIFYHHQQSEDIGVINWLIRDYYYYQSSSIVTGKIKQSSEPLGSTFTLSYLNRTSCWTRHSEICQNWKIWVSVFGENLQHNVFVSVLICENSDQQSELVVVSLSWADLTHDALQCLKSLDPLGLTGSVSISPAGFLREATQAARVFNFLLALLQPCGCEPSLQASVCSLQRCTPPPCWLQSVGHAAQSSIRKRSEEVVTTSLRNWEYEKHKSQPVHQRVVTLSDKTDESEEVNLSRLCSLQSRLIGSEPLQRAARWADWAGWFPVETSPGQLIISLTWRGRRASLTRK